MMSRYVYIRSGSDLWTAGYYDPTGKWHSESDHESRGEAAEQVNFLNGDNNEKVELNNWQTRYLIYCLKRDTDVST